MNLFAMRKQPTTADVIFKPLTQINSSILEKTILADMNTLDKNTRQSLKAWLLVRETQLRDEIDSGQKSGEDSISAETREVNDQEEQASMRERSTIQDAEVQRDSTEFIDVRAALARLNDGSYGVCVDCGQPIDLQRLVAIPSAARCMACQIKSESKANRA